MIAYENFDDVDDNENFDDVDDNEILFRCITSLISKTNYNFHFEVNFSNSNIFF